MHPDATAYTHTHAHTRTPARPRSAPPHSSAQFCKRVLIDNSYFETLRRPNVELVTNRITRISPEGPVTDEDGTIAADVVLWGTGFHSNRFLMPMVIRNGPEAGASASTTTLEAAWAGEPRAHLGITVPKFPNLFLLYGPNTNLGHSSIIFHTECQVQVRVQVQVFVCAWAV